MGKIRVAVDGPVSSGKTTAGRNAAERLRYLFIDTGLMYRAVAWKIHDECLGQDGWKGVAETMRFDFLADGKNIPAELSAPEISALSSRVAAEPGVRKALVAAQRAMAKARGVVMVGRDIGTVVLPDAELKIFLTASPEIRALRRYEELKENGGEITLSDVESQMRDRDARDSTRKDSPLAAAAGAVFIDSSAMTLDAVVEKIVSLAKAREKEK